MRDEQWQLHDLVRSMGLNRSYVGYDYLIYSLELLREDENRLEMVTKGIYPGVARKFKVPISAVDGALRTAVNVCWRRGPWELTGRQSEDEQSPSVSVFLGRLVRLDRTRNGIK